MEEFRKNPAIVFQYKTLVDDATRPITVIGSAVKPRTTAEKVVQAKTGQAPVRTTTDSIRIHQGTGPIGTGGGSQAMRRNTGPVAGSTGRNKEAA